MKYDFESVPDRSGVGSNKWDSCKNASVENVPLSVADMEFPTAPEIVEEIKNLADSTILGYSGPTEEYKKTVVSWMKRRHDYEIEEEWLLQTPGVVYALGILIEAVTKPKDSVLMLTPVYYPFDLAVLAKSRRIVYSKLVDKNGHYEINYKDLEEKCKRKDVTALLFCNPHNPVGRVWTKEELRRVAEICHKYGVFIIDDEIHNDIIMPGYEHTVMAKVSEDIADEIAVCTAPSKTFNIAGLQCSNIIVKNEKVRLKAMALSLINLENGLNIFAYKACMAAYNRCEDWLTQMIETVAGNEKIVRDFFAENYPEIYVHPLEGTYLLWVDMRKSGLNHREMKKLLQKQNIYLDNGEIFGPAGRGYQRINLACSPVTIKKALARFKNGMDEIKKEWEEKGKPFHQELKTGERMESFTFDSTFRSGANFSDIIEKPTLLVFSRYYGCEICMATLAFFKASYPIFKASGIDIKVVVQSSKSELKQAGLKYPFEIIADPKAELYDRYNVFEMDSASGLVAGDKLLEAVIGKDVKKLLGFDMITGMISGFFDSPEEGEVKPRGNQTSAFVGLENDMTVKYKYFSSSMLDFPSPIKIIKEMRG